MVVILAMDVRPCAVPLMLTFFINIMLLSLSVLWCSYSQSCSIVCNYTLMTTPVILGVIIVFAVNMSVILTSSFRSIKFLQVSRVDHTLAPNFPVTCILYIMFLCFFYFEFYEETSVVCLQKLHTWIC
jgi:hypothetical protein